jgi:hypothetical protein
MRLHKLAVLGLLPLAGYAGSIPAGGTLNYIGQYSGTTALGLTNAYMTGTGGCTLGVSSCVSSSLGSGMVEKNYDATLFSGATNSGGSPTTPVPFSGFTNSATGVEPAGTILGSGTNSFAMISDSDVAGAPSNFWDATSTATTTVAVGLSNVNDVALMLGNIFGVAGANDVDVEFDFGTSSNGGINDSIVLDLTNSGTAGSGASGEIQSAASCPSSPCGTNNLASGAALASGTLTTAAGSTTTGQNVGFTTTNLASNLFGPSLGNTYTSIGGNAASYGGTTGGTLNLTSIDFNFSQLALVFDLPTEYLVDIKVEALQAGANNSRVALSAVTVDTVTSTPEPSTVFMFLTGLGALGIARFRRK